MTTTAPASTPPNRTPPRRKARQLAKYLRDERPDYAYLKAVFRHLRDELGVDVARERKRLPYVPSDDGSAATTKWSGTPGGPATPSWSRPCSTPG